MAASITGTAPMNLNRKHVLLYLSEAVLIALLCFVPLDSPLQALTVAGLFSHLTTSLAFGLFEWRYQAIGAGSGIVFGMSNATFCKLVCVAGLVLLAAWPFAHSGAAWIWGIFLTLAGIELMLGCDAAASA
jgi:hypothetical protein